MKATLALAAVFATVLFSSCQKEGAIPSQLTTTPAPVINTFAPQTGAVGTTVTINGTNFSTSPAANQVQFNGVTATINSVSATQLVVTVPPKSSTGRITVIVSETATVSAVDFTVPGNTPPIDHP